MIQIATALPTISVGPARATPPAALSSASEFTLALSSLLLPGIAPKGDAGEPALADVTVLDRQPIAEPGKELPDIVLDLSDEEDAPEQGAEPDDDASAGEDVPLAWFALPAAPAHAPAANVPVADAPPALRTAVVPESQPIEVPFAEAGLPDAPVDSKPSKIEGAQTPADADPQPATPATAPRAGRLERRAAERPVLVVPVASPQIKAGAAPVVPVQTAMPGSPIAPPAPLHAAAPVPLAAPAVIAGAPVRPDAVPAPAVQPVAPQSLPQPTMAAAPKAGAAQADAPHIEMATPVAQAARLPVVEPAQPSTMAALIAQASAQAAPAQPIAFTALRRTVGELDQPGFGTLAAPGAQTLQQVAAAPDTQQGALDLRRQEWIGKMVETIEAMREAAPVKETRISLVPDALGKIDISVRQDGDRVHVHFATETQAARQILTEAQPRLSELAEQRGVRLGQTSVDSQGAGAQSGQRHSDAPRAANPSAPASARAAKDPLNHADDRVA